MKKIYSLMAGMMVSAAMFAQVNVTYQVDITDYLYAGNTLGAGGIRIAGNFLTNGAMNGANAMVDWGPTDANSAMTETTDDVWTITVTYAAGGAEQVYKFVNDNWGTNEGTDPGNTIATDGCGTDDGAGNINRTLVIPDADVTYQYCWDHCLKCDGSSPLVSIINVKPSALNLSISPNPAIDYVAFTYTIQNAETVMLDVYSMMGEHVGSVVNEMQTSGVHAATFNASDLASGNYIYRLQVGNYVTSGSIVKN